MSSPHLSNLFQAHGEDESVDVEFCPGGLSLNSIQNDVTKQNQENDISNLEKKIKDHKTFTFFE